jgi:hypothetical protein
MARELVERNGIGETADAVWKALNAEHQRLFPASQCVATDPPGADDFRPDGPPEEGIPASPVFVFGQTAAPFGRRARRARPPVPEQASLFSLS